MSTDGHGPTQTATNGESQAAAVLATVLRVLNEALAADEAAVRGLLRCRMRANQALVEHPTIGVLPASNGNCDVGMLGLINGFVEPLTGARIRCLRTATDGHVQFSAEPVVGSGIANSRSQIADEKGEKV